jgi:hypothetical protein
MLLGSSFREVLPATLLLIGFAIIGGIIIFYVRKSMHSSPSKSTTFTLSELRSLRDEGSISEEEYEQARQSIIDQTH